MKLTTARSAPLGMTVMTNPGFGVAEISSTWPGAARTVASPPTMRKLRRYRPSPSESQPSTVDGDADADGDALGDADRGPPPRDSDDLPLGPADVGGDLLAGSQLPPLRHRQEYRVAPVAEGQADGHGQLTRRQHLPALALAVRKGRQEEFKRFSWAGEVPDPQDEQTFLRSKIDRAHRDTPIGLVATLTYYVATCWPSGGTPWRRRRSACGSSRTG